VEDIKVGDIIVVKPGERIPLDGKVVEGRTMLDTSALTGESFRGKFTPVKLSSPVQSINEPYQCRSYKTVWRIHGVKNTGLGAKRKQQKSSDRKLYHKVCRILHSRSSFYLSGFGSNSSAGCSRCRFLRLGLQSTHIPCNLMSLRSGNIHTLGFFGGIGGASKTAFSLRAATS